MLLIHIETGNISFDNHNRNKSIDEFLLKQQDDCKKIIHKTLTYKDPFLYYIKYCLNDIDAERFCCTTTNIQSLKGNLKLLEMKLSWMRLRAEINNIWSSLWLSLLKACWCLLRKVKKNIKGMKNKYKVARMDLFIQT